MSNPTSNLVAALREAREYILDNGNERTMAPVVARIDDALRSAPETLTAKSGFEEAFWRIAEALDLPAMPISPKQAFETVMLPKIRQLAAASAAETKAPRYLRPSMGTGSMFASQYKMAVTDEWCRGWNALLSAQEAAGCETDSNSPWPPLVPCPDCKGAGEVCTGHSGRDDDGNAPLLETCETCDRYGRVAASSPKTSSEGPL